MSNNRMTIDDINIDIQSDCCMKASFYRPECAAGFVVDFESSPSSSRFTTSDLDLLFLWNGGTANIKLCILLVDVSFSFSHYQL